MAEKSCGWKTWTWRIKNVHAVKGVSFSVKAGEIVAN